MSAATPKAPVTDAEPFAEFVNALELVEQWQLANFTNGELSDKDSLIARYHEAVQQAETYDAGTDASSDVSKEKRIGIMREILADTVKQYKDKYANYIYPEALKIYKARRNGMLFGVGLKYRVFNNALPVVIGPLLGGPLDGEDIRPGDRLVSIDDKPVAGLNAKEIEKALKNTVSLKAKIEILRNHSNHVIEVARSTVELLYADADMLDSNIGYVKVSRFGSKTHVQVESLLTKLIEQGAKGFVLDLRDVPGGSTRAARAIVSMFTKEKVIYLEEDKSGVITKMPRYGEHITDLPLAVLVNAKSMSCAEVVAGAIKTFNRGTIVGVRSFGKGLVQRVFELEEPLGGAVRATIAVMMQPDKQAIHNTGIAPDICIQTDFDVMFKRTGSLNISAEARAFQRKLLEHTIMKRKPDRAQEYLQATDQQLQAAVKLLATDR